MYESPITIYQTDAILEDLQQQETNAVMLTVNQRFKTQVDLEELIRALHYDRQQYEKGYLDALQDIHTIYTHAELIKSMDDNEFHEWLKQHGLLKSPEIIIHDWPVTDVAPVVHGKWLWDEDGMDWNIGSWVCSACHSRPETLWEGTKNINPYRKSGSHYCPNCGAKMDTV